MLEAVGRRTGWRFASLLLIPVLLAILAPRDAEAGRRPFIWTWDTQIVPAGDLELEQWLWVRGRIENPPVRDAAHWVWWGPVYGVNDHVELAVPFQVLANQDRTVLESFEADLRMRFFPREEEPFFSPLLRLAYHHGIPRNVPSRIDSNLVLRIGEREGVRGNVELGAQLGLPGLRGKSGNTALLLTWAGGVSVPLRDGDVTLALETFGEVPGDGRSLDLTHGFVGPTVGFTRGRVWATLGVLIGLTPLFPDTPQFMPRLIWAVVL